MKTTWHQACFIHIYAAQQAGSRLWREVDLFCNSSKNILWLLPKERTLTQEQLQKSNSPHGTLIMYSLTPHHFSPNKTMQPSSMIESSTSMTNKPLTVFRLLLPCPVIISLLLNILKSIWIKQPLISLYRNPINTSLNYLILLDSRCLLVRIYYF